MDRLKQDRKIDKFALDDEWLHQPDLYEKYGKMLVEAENERDYAKDLLDIEKAKLELAIRNSPKSFGLKDKPTEGAIKSVIITNQKIIDLNHDHLELIKQAKDLAVVVRKIDSHRKKALEKLTELFFSGYYSKPTMNEATMKKAAQSVKMEQNEKLKTRRRKRNTSD